MKVLFICTGNTCRSPMAAGLAQRLFPEWQCFSAGLMAWEGEPASREARAVMKEQGLSLEAHRSVSVKKALLEEADLVLTMTKVQEQQLKRLYPQIEDKIKRLGDQAGWDGDVIDPWGGSREVYRTCLQELKNMLERIAER